MKTVAFRRTDSACFATGGRDNAILIWDTRARIPTDNMSKADNCILSGHATGPGTPQAYRRKATRQTPKLPPNTSSSSITGLAFQVSSVQKRDVIAIDLIAFSSFNSCLLVVAPLIADIASNLPNRTIDC